MVLYWELGSLLLYGDKIIFDLVHKNQSTVYVVPECASLGPLTFGLH